MFQFTSLFFELWCSFCLTFSMIFLKFCFKWETNEQHCTNWNSKNVFYSLKRIVWRWQTSSGNFYNVYFRPLHTGKRKVFVRCDQSVVHARHLLDITYDYVMCLGITHLVLNKLHPFLAFVRFLFLLFLFSFLFLTEFPMKLKLQGVIYLRLGQGESRELKHFVNSHVA